VVRDPQLTIPARVLRRNRSARLTTTRAKIQAAHRGNNPTLLPEPKCYTVSQFSSRGHALPFHNFDESYVQRLRQGDFRTMDHFVSYFGDLLQLKLRSRLRSPQAVEDVRQETFVRVLAAVRDDKIREPERFGSYVFSICKNILLEGHRVAQRDTSLEDGEDQDFPDRSVDIFGAFAAKQTKEKVRDVLEKLPELDRRLLRDVFLEERDKDEVCRDFGVTRDYLRVLVYRAKQSFKVEYLAS
jgi:RNA polymerase sigma-70 factor (ECF subfamily)